jgi:chromosomal replication initiator protein
MREVLRNSFEKCIQVMEPEFLGQERVYLRGLLIEDLEKSVLVLCARHAPPSKACLQKARIMISAAMSNLLGTTISVRIQALRKEGLERGPADSSKDPILDDSNRTAHLLLGALAERKAPDLNPVFIYGPAGVGKSHLVRWFLSKNDVEASYWEGLDFYKVVSGTLRAGEFGEFRKSLLQIKLLVLDEVHRLRGKHRTQEELCLLMDEWMARGTQVLFLGRHHPNEIRDIGPGLASRFLGGFTVEMRSPSPAAREEFLRRAGFSPLRAQRELPQAGRPRLSYRDLDRMLQHHRKGGTIERSAAEESPCRVENCLERVAVAFGLDVSEIHSRSSCRKVSLPRQVSVYLLRREGKSHSELARTFGWKSASSVHYAIQRIEERMAKDRKFREIVERLGQ